MLKNQVVRQKYFAYCYTCKSFFFPCKNFSSRYISVKELKPHSCFFKNLSINFINVNVSWIF